MKYHKDRAVVLSRVDYGEKDRILTLLCQQEGRVSVLAKGVRAQKSRLAGGIELLSESEVSFVESRSGVSPLTSARLIAHFENLAKDVKLMQQAFSFIKIIDQITEESAGQEYYEPLLTALKSLDGQDYDARLVDIWFNLQLLRLSGSSPNLKLDSSEASKEYDFDYDNQQFVARAEGGFTQNDLKLLRLGLTQTKPPKLLKELGSEAKLQALTKTLLKISVTEV